MLFRLDEIRRFEILQEAITQGAALAVAESEVVIYGQEHGKFRESQPPPESERTVTAQHLEQLEEIVLQKIRIASKNGTLFSTPNLVSILYRWKAWTLDEDEVKTWVLEMTQDDNHLARLLEQFGRIQTRQIIGDRAVRQHYRLDPAQLEPFIDPDKIIDRARVLAARSDLPNEQLVAAKQFVKEYDLRKQGKHDEDEL